MTLDDRSRGIYIFGMEKSMTIRETLQVNQIFNLDFLSIRIPGLFARLNIASYMHSFTTHIFHSTPCSWR